MALRAEVGRLLPAIDGAFPTAVATELSTFLSEAAGARSVRLWLADYEQAVLSELATGSGAQVVERIPVTADTEVARAYAEGTLLSTPVEDGFIAVSVPIILRGERIGVLKAELPEPVDEETELGLSDVALTLAYVLTLATRFTDVFEEARRTRPLSVQAEMQWSLLAARAFASEQFTLAGRLLPPYDVGGDVYDFAVDPDALWVAVIDAMGHGAQASVLAALADHALRNARRGGLNLPDQAAVADEALRDVFGGDRFVTGVLLHIDLGSATLTVTNAGHPPPFLLRQGELQLVGGEPELPMGLDESRPTAVATVSLQPGDRLVIISDGVLEGVLPDGREYGETHLTDQVVETGHLDAPTAVDALQHHLTRHVGAGLRDDATIVILDWHATSEPADG